MRQTRTSPTDPVAAASPMDNEHNLIGFEIVVNHDFLNEDTRQPLLGSRVGARRIPSQRQILSKSQ